VRDIGRRGRANLLALAVEARHNRLIPARVSTPKDSEGAISICLHCTAPLLFFIVISSSLRGLIQTVNQRD
jgi:hypothetical protein